MPKRPEEGKNGEVNRGDDCGADQGIRHEQCQEIELLVRHFKAPNLVIEIGKIQNLDCKLPFSIDESLSAQAGIAKDTYITSIKKGMYATEA